MTETAGTPLQACLASAPPLFAGRYRASQLLGRGGMGEVHAVLDESSGRQLALKRLFAASSERQAAAFEREYRTLATLAHPHIVEVYDYVVDAEGAFYTMELLRGGDLTSSGPRPWREICRVIRDIASTLGLLHARRILHRDLSPKNIWCLPDGRIKLIDFGALTAFGPVSDVVGTPPFIPPEALGRQALDQRSDLYALGALAYWLLTGHHAVSARSLSELPSAWKVPVTPPSQRGRPLDDEPLPPELDALVESLLHQEPAFRPPSTAALIDQLNALAGLPGEATDRAALDLLRNPALVARGQDQIRLGGALRKADRGQGDSVIVEAEQGLGRTRLLEEMSVSSRLLGISTLSADVSAGERPFGVAASLALRLLETLPAVARKAAQPFASELALLSPALQARLGARPAQLAGCAPGERRMRMSAALLGWFSKVAESRTLALFVDDLSAVDDESLSWLLSLAHHAQQRRLLLVGSLARNGNQRSSRPVAALRKLSRRLVLKPFTLEDTQQLLGSLFGDAPYSMRLGERLQRETEGNPSHCLLLLENLVRSGVISYADGVWSLPLELSETALLHDRNGARRARLEHITPDERALARRLSVHGGSLPRALCARLGAHDERAADDALSALIRARILVDGEGGLHFAHEDLRFTLLAELSADETTTCHRAVGELLLESQADNALDRLRAALHLMRGGDQQRSARLINQVTLHFGSSDPTYLGSAVPLFEEALSLLQARGAAPHQCMGIQAVLSVAGYYVDRRLAVRHGDAALSALNTALYLHWARALGPYLGRKPALLLSLFVAFVVFSARRNDPLQPSLKDTLLLLFYCASTLAGVGAVCIDSAASARAAEAIEPLAALGKDHIAAFVFRYCSALALQSTGQLSESAREWQRILARLDQPEPPRGMPEHMIVQYRAGALLAYGVKATWRDGPEALQIADQLSRIGMKLYEMSAEQLRAGYYANQGQLALFEQHKQLLDLHAIQRGTTWQVETWAPNTLMTSAQRIDDVLLMKRAMADGERVSREVDVLVPYVARARATYCVLTRRYHEALNHLEQDPQGSNAPQSYVVWARMRGTLARALNGLGDHARALSVCQHALDHMHADDRSFVAMNLIVEVELALAQLGLGQRREAARTLDQLLARHAANNSPLTMFTLHEARAQVAHAAGASELAQQQLALAKQHAETLSLPPLLARSARLEKLLGGVISGVMPQGTMLSIDGSAFVATCIQKLLSQDSEASSLSQRADITLSVAMELSGADRGLVLAANPHGPPALLAGSEHAKPDLLSWVEERLLNETRVDGCTITEDSDAPLDPEVMVLEGAHYRVTPLWAVQNNRDVVVGAVALGMCDQVPLVPPVEALRVMGSRLSEALQGEQREQVATVS